MLLGNDYKWSNTALIIVLFLCVVIDFYVRYRSNSKCESTCLASRGVGEKSDH